MGTAQAVSGGVAQGQAARAQDQQHAAAYRDQQAAPPPAGGPATNELIEQLTKLGELHRAGVLTDAEFAAQKAKLLG